MRDSYKELLDLGAHLMLCGRSKFTPNAGEWWAPKEPITGTAASLEEIHRHSSLGSLIAIKPKSVGLFAIDIDHDVEQAENWVLDHLGTPLATQLSKRGIHFFYPHNETAFDGAWSMSGDGAMWTGDGRSEKALVVYHASDIVRAVERMRKRSNFAVLPRVGAGSEMSLMAIERIEGMTNLQDTSVTVTFAHMAQGWLNTNGPGYKIWDRHNPLVLAIQEATETHSLSNSDWWGPLHSGPVKTARQCNTT